MRRFTQLLPGQLSLDLRNHHTLAGNKLGASGIARLDSGLHRTDQRRRRFLDLHPRGRRSLRIDPEFGADLDQNFLVLARTLARTFPILLEGPADAWPTLFAVRGSRKHVDCR